MPPTNVYSTSIGLISRIENNKTPIDERDLTKFDISDKKSYLSDLSKSFLDKIDFMNYLNPEIKIIIDFGCADGFIIHMLQQIYPQYRYIGIENNLDFIKECRNKYGKSIEIYQTLQDFYENNDIEFSTVHINMSSVLHEIFTYEKYPKRLLSNIFKVYNFRSISIRDMAYKDYNNSQTGLKPGNNGNKYNEKDKNIDYISKLFLKLYKKINKFEALSKYLSDEEKTKTFDYLNLCDILLKYNYNDNYDNERKEKYNCYDEFNGLQILLTSHGYNYNLLYKNSYTPTYLMLKWIKDFELDYQLIFHLKNIKTHLQAFYTKDKIQTCYFNIHNSSYDKDVYNDIYGDDLFEPRDSISREDMMLQRNNNQVNNDRDLDNWILDERYNEYNRNNDDIALPR